MLERHEARLGRLDSAAVLALGIATVDGARAAAALSRFDFRPTPDDELLGGRGLVAPMPSGRSLVLLEPTREGRLAAFLARHGEALAAVYVAAPVGTGPPIRRRGTALGREGWLAPGAAVDEPQLVLVVTSPSPAGTIHP